MCFNIRNLKLFILLLLILKYNYNKILLDFYSSTILQGDFHFYSSMTIGYFSNTVGRLPDQGSSPPIAQFGLEASSRKSLGGSKHLPFKNDGGYCVLGDLQCCRNILVLVSVPQLNHVSGGLRTIPSTSWLSFGSDMHSQIWDLI